jgi:hypothetical protein
MPKVSLIIIYNHRYIKNIETLESLYRHRFASIFHLMPFYEGKKNNVIPVYENSRYFQGYIAQAWRALNACDSDDFIFVADDLLLNPIVNQDNYRDFLGVDDATSFIPHPILFHKLKSFWWRSKEALEWRPQGQGLELNGMLPTGEDALARYIHHGLKPEPFPAYLANPDLKPLHSSGEKLVSLPYPLIGGYSDIIALPRATMDKFALYCGIFAATHLFVEVAIPSALAMASPKLIYLAESKLSDGPCALWTPQDFHILETYNQSLSRLLNNFPQGRLFLHPIKLSQWKN